MKWQLRVAATLRRCQPVYLSRVIAARYIAFYPVALFVLTVSTNVAPATPDGFLIFTNFSGEGFLPETP